MRRTLILAVLHTVVFIAVINFGMLAQVGEDEVFLGFTQLDQITYLANAREVFEGGNGLFYSNPYSLDPDSPRIYTHLGIVAAAWAWRLGIPFIVWDQAARLVFGSAMFMLWWALAGVFFRNRRMRIAATAIGWTGAGLAWVFALLHGGNAGYLVAFDAVERSYAWWFYNLWRNLMYSTECLYHTLAFATLLLLAKRRWSAGAFALILTWWAHPFTGLEIGFIVGLYLGLTCLVRRRRGPWLTLGVTTVISAVGALYNGWFLGRFSEHRIVMEQWQTLDFHVYSAEVWPAYGVLIALSLPALLTRRGWRWMWATGAGRLWTAWLVGAWLLALHDNLPLVERPVQPSHFTRGYCYLPLVISALRGLRIIWWRASSALVPRWALMVMCLMLIPDNVIFLVQYLRRDAREAHVNIVAAADWEVVEYLRTIPDPRMVAVIVENPLWGVDYFIPSFTHHQSLVGHMSNAPGYREKFGLVRDALESGDPAPLVECGVSLVVIPRDAMFDGREVWSNSAWRVLEID